MPWRNSILVTQLWSFHLISHHLVWPCSHTTTNSEYSEFWNKKIKRNWAHFNQIVVRHACSAMLHTTNIRVPYEISESFLKVVSIGTEHRLFFYPIAFLNIPASSSRINLSSRTKTKRKSAKILTRILHAFARLKSLLRQVRSMKHNCCKMQYWVIKTPGVSGEGEKKTVTERVVVMTDSPSPASRSCGSSTQWPRSAEADRNRRPPLWQASYWGPCSTEKDDARNDPRFLPTQTCTSRAFRIHAIHCCSQKKPKNPKKQKKKKKKKKNPAFLPAPEVLWIPNPKPKLKPAPEHCDNNFWRKRKQKQRT